MRAQGTRDRAPESAGECPGNGVARVAALFAAAAGLAVLGFAWLGPLVPLAAEKFAAHMGVHLAVVCVAAPLIAVGLAASDTDPVERRPALFAPLPASFVELVVVWGWHLPAAHHAARASGAVFVLEQMSFLGAGLVLWLSVVGGARRARRERALVGVIALLLTSMHMSLLGALLTLAPRPLYGHGADFAALLADQRWGGLLMLAGGGLTYLIGGLMLLDRVLRTGAGARRDPL